MGLIDLADIRPCFFCGVDALHVRDIDDNVVQLEPQAIQDGATVTSGWRRQHRQWVVHLGSVSPDEPAFRVHPCAGNKPRRDIPVTQSDPFGQAAPPGANGPSCEELEGKLILLDVVKIERDVTTKFGPADAVRGTVVDLTSGETHPDALLFGKVLVGQFIDGTKYVGRITKGQAVPPNSPPWTWVDGDADDKATAVAYLNHVNGLAVATQAAPPSTPAPAAPLAEPVATPAAPRPAWMK